MTSPRVVIVGLGPAGSSYRSAGAAAALADKRPLLLRTSRHPDVDELIRGGARPLDRYYEGAASFSEIYAAIVEDVVGEARRHGSVTYAVPGSPLVLEATVEALRGDPRVETEIVLSLSFLDLAWERLSVDPVASAVRLLDAQVFASRIGERTGPLLVAHTHSRQMLSDVKLALADEGVPAVLLHHLGLPDELVREVALSDLDRTLEPDHLTSVFLPLPVGAVGLEVASLVEVVRELRERCPWDREQTHRSLVRHFVEETYEAIDAIEALSDPPELDEADLLEEELGDVLCQVLFHATIASEEGLFSFADVARRLREKLVARHPHVFGDAEALENADDVLARWEESKRIEKGRASAMDGIPDSLPALLYAQKVARRAAGNEDQRSGAREQIRNGVAAFLAGDEDALGELLFAIAALANGDVEELLRQHVRRMRRLSDEASRSKLDPSPRS